MMFVNEQISASAPSARKPFDRMPDHTNCMNCMTLRNTGGPMLRKENRNQTNGDEEAESNTRRRGTCDAA